MNGGTKQKQYAPLPTFPKFGGGGGGGGGGIKKAEKLPGVSNPLNA